MGSIRNHVDNWADNQVDNWADNRPDNWADSWGDLNENRLHLFKRKTKRGK